MLPLFQGPHWQLLGMTLVCDSDGLARWYEMNMRPGLKVAFVSRGCGANPGNAKFQAQTVSQAPCPIDRLADRVYLRPGWQTAGKLPGSSGSIFTEDWGTVMVEKSTIP